MTNQKFVRLRRVDRIVEFNLIEGTVIRTDFLCGRTGTMHQISKRTIAHNRPFRQTIAATIGPGSWSVVSHNCLRKIPT